MHVVVCGALVENGAVLLVHRSPTRWAYPDLWDLPGGHVEAGESELSALAREMHEELGVNIVAESSSRLGDLHAAGPSCPAPSHSAADQGTRSTSTLRRAYSAAMSSERLTQRLVPARAGARGFA
ncbi:NUDIX domain-containing protein [Micromonospora arborensis]|uniref:NUDIX domain-containing protein n=1 Tax=Micromonospora arborensis TaxID=2116518 RepID=UPI00371DF064